MPDAPTITLGEHSATLIRPPALFVLAMCRDPEQAAAEGHEVSTALGAAALRMCWPDTVAWPSRPRPVPWRPGIRIERYGSEVFESLADSGLDLLGLLDPCTQAYVWAMQSRIKQDEVDSASVFSEAQEGA